MSQNNEGEDLSIHSDLFYSLIRSKEFFKNKGKGPKKRSGNMFSPGSDDGSETVVAAAATSADISVDEIPCTDFRNSDSEFGIKGSIEVHVSEFVPFFMLGKFHEFFTDKPPGPLDERNAKNPAKVTLQAKMCEWNNYGNKSCYHTIMLAAFETLRSRKYNSLNDCPGVMDLITTYAKLLMQVLHEIVPSWRSERIDVSLLFRKLKNSLVNFRANQKKAE